MKRIYHTWDKWECYPAGFYETQPLDRKLTQEEGEREYHAFLSNIPTFRAALSQLLKAWPRSCEHYLSNENMNRIAWLGQASVCLACGIPSCFRGGYNLLSDEQKLAADQAALAALNTWLTERGEPTVTLETAGSKTKCDLY